MKNIALETQSFFDHGFWLLFVFRQSSEKGHVEIGMNIRKKLVLCYATVLCDHDIIF